MLKTRIIGVLIVRKDIVVQSIGFCSYMPVGIPWIAVEYLDRWGIDEIVVLDIDATPENRSPRFDYIRQYSQYCHVPLSIGGGIRTVEDVTKSVHAGADKVVINTAAAENPRLITEVAQSFGSQCIVVSIDAKRKLNGTYEVFTRSGKQATGLSPVMLAQRAEEYGAGEIFINSIDQDGSKKGYDMDLMNAVIKAVKIPVVICGGVGNPRHLLEGMKSNVSGVAAANFFHYTEHSVIIAKQLLKTSGKNIRLDSYTTYHGVSFDRIGRARKIEDAILDKLRFEYIPEEII